MTWSTRFLSITVAVITAAGGTHAAEPSKAARLADLLGTAVADAVDVALPSTVVIKTFILRDHTVVDEGGEMNVVQVPLAGQGSGVIFSPDGFVMTSAHVVEHEGAAVKVVTDDGKEYDGKIIGKDPNTDLAVLKIEHPDGEPFPSIEKFDSDKVRIGQFVIAIGSPLGLDKSATLGIVSQKERQVGQFYYENYIQTDAAINTGNSGGPLVNVYGQWVGINSMIQTTGGSGGNIGIGFVVPSNLAMQVADSLMKYGQMVRSYIGFLPEDIDSTQTAGVRVVKVIPGSPADKGGLLVGDIVLECQGKPTPNVFEIKRIMHPHQPGDTIRFTVVRDGKRNTVTIVAEPVPQRKKATDE